MGFPCLFVDPALSFFCFRLLSRNALSLSRGVPYASVYKELFNFIVVKIFFNCDMEKEGRKEVSGLNVKVDKRAKMRSKMASSRGSARFLTMTSEEDENLLECRLADKVVKEGEFRLLGVRSRPFQRPEQRRQFCGWDAQVVSDVSFLLLGQAGVR